MSHAESNGVKMGAGLVMIALVGAFLFDTDGSALGLTLFGLSPDGLIAGIFGIFGDLVWIVGAVAAFLAIASVVNLTNDDTAKQAVILQYLVSVAKGIPTGKLYPVQSSYAKGVAWLALLMALVGMGSGFWFTGTAWFFSVLFTQAQLKKFRSIRETLDGLVLDGGMNAVRQLATPATLTAFSTATDPKKDDGAPDLESLIKVKTEK